MAQPAQTAQSEQRQDTGVTAELLRTGWGRAVLILAGSSPWPPGWRRAAGHYYMPHGPPLLPVVGCGPRLPRRRVINPVSAGQSVNQPPP